MKWWGWLELLFTLGVLGWCFPVPSGAQLVNNHAEMTVSGGAIKAERVCAESPQVPCGLLKGLESQLNLSMPTRRLQKNEGAAVARMW